MKKLVQVTTVGLLATLGAQVAMRLAGVPGWHVERLLLSVGVPSAFAAAVFFPVSPQAVASRWALCWRVAVPTAAVCVVNRLLVFRVWEGGDLTRLVPVPSALDLNARLLLGALAVASVFACVAQPLMQSVARQPR